jgi:hypothetical protein
MSVVVIDEAESYRLTTLDALKSELGVTGSADDVRLLRLINEASDAVAAWCDRVFGLEEIEETQRVTFNTDALVLARYPVAELSIEVDGAPFDTSDMLVDLAAGTVTALGEGFSPWRGSLVARYVGGYRLPGEAARNLPPSIERAALELAKRWYFAAGRDPLIRSEATDGIATVAYAADVLPASVVALLAPHRNRRLR